MRITDAETVRLLRVGDRVDVITPGASAEASPGLTRGDGARTGPRVVARGVPVEKLPDSAGEVADGVGGDGREGALVVLRVSRRTATELAGAAARGPLTVALV